MEKRKMIIFIKFWLPVILWAGVIFYASSQPYQKQDLKPTLSSYINVDFLTPYLDSFRLTYAGSEVSVIELGTAGFIEFFIRKGAHFAVYFILAFLLYRALKNTSKWAQRKCIALTYIASVVYAASDEFHQSLTPNRSPHWEDVALDSVGVLFGVAIAAIIYKRYVGKQSIKKISEG